MSESAAACTHADETRKEQNHAPLSDQDIIDNFQFLEHLATQLPPHVRELSKEEQVQYILDTANSFRQHRELEEEAKRFHQEYRKLIAEKYKHLHPHLLDATKWEWNEEFLAALNSSDKDRIMSMLKRECDGIYSVDLLKPTTCNQILEEVAHFEEWCDKHGLQINRPNSMNNYGAILDDFGFYNTLDAIMKTVVNPISALLFPHVGATLDHHHGFIVEYALDKDVKLDFHVDDSEVTMNLCLGTEFEGGELYFGGVRCNHHQQTGTLPDEECVIQHEIGRALFHLGRHRHLAKPLISGRRANLILWCRSSKFRKLENTLECHEWCGLNKYLQMVCEHHGAECCCESDSDDDGEDKDTA